MPSSLAPERQAFVERIRTELDRLADEVVLKEHSPAVSADLAAELEMDLQRADALAARAASLHIDNWDEIANQLEQATIRLRLALTARAADQRASTADEVEAARQAVLDQLASWQTFLEELVVQGHLAGMDMRDTLDLLARRRQEIGRYLRHTALHPVTGTAEALADLRHAALHAWRAGCSSAESAKPAQHR